MCSTLPRLQVLYFAAIAAASTGVLIGKITNPPGSWYKKLLQQSKMDNLRRQAEESPGLLRELFVNTITVTAFARLMQLPAFACVLMAHAAVTGWMDDVVIRSKLLWFENEWIKAVTFLSTWVSIGIVYGMFSSQQMTFLTALYFAVTSISTAGLEGLKPFTELSDRIGPDNNILVNEFDFYTAWKYQVQRRMTLQVLRAHAW